MEIGAILWLDEDMEQKMQDLAASELYSCQLICWNEAFFTDEMAARILAATKATGVKIRAVWCGWQGPIAWNFYEGQGTLGLVPAAYRFARMQTLCKGSDFAKKLDVPHLITHVGYLPENPCDPVYQDVLVALRFVVRHCTKNGQSFLFETGQETPVTLRRAIQDLGMPNVGINIDPANLLMYGKGNPVDALDVFGEYVLGVHGKDGEYPTDGHALGEEKPIGEGRVNFPAFITKLKEIGYQGPITIECELAGEEQKADILRGKALLEQLIAAN